MIKKLLKLALVVAVIWFLFYPKPYTILFIILMGTPLLTILIYGFQKSSFMFWHPPKTYGYRNYNFFNNIFTLAPWAVTFRVLLDFDFESNTLFNYLMGSSISVLYLLLMLFLIVGNKTNFGKGLKKSLFILNMMVYFLTAVYGINCVFDYSKPLVYNVAIRGHFRKGSKGAYTIKLAPWGNVKDERTIGVNHHLYRNNHTGSKIGVNYKKGLFNIPWYYITDNNSYDIYILQ